jgi:hypothetical protein
MMTVKITIHLYIESTDRHAMIYGTRVRSAWGPRHNQLIFLRAQSPLFCLIAAAAVVLC